MKRAKVNQLAQINAACYAPKPKPDPRAEDHALLDRSNAWHADDYILIHGAVGDRKVFNAFTNIYAAEKAGKGKINPEVYTLEPCRDPLRKGEFYWAATCSI